MDENENKTKQNETKQWKKYMSKIMKTFYAE